MKIAIPSDEGTYLSQHFGRTLGFKIFEINDGSIIGEEYRQNTFTGHAMGHHQDHGHDHHHHGENDGHAQHSHHRILGALHDCEVVIAGGMGRRLFDDLTENGKQIFITTQPETRKAVELFLADQLTSDKKTCSHHD
jgi:predicted Fe-Mo cluster-binding NifX family protein